MFVLSFRYPRNRITDILLCMICLFVIILILFNGEKVTQASSDEYLSDIVDFLMLNGWEVDSSGAEAEKIIFPDISDESMADYCRIQAEQGMDIVPYTGIQLIRYTFEVLNYPDSDDGVYASVFVYEDKIVAADIHSVSINGFIHGVIKNE